VAIKRDNYFKISKVYKKRTPPNLPFRKGEELKTPSLFEKGGLGLVKKNYRIITVGLLTILLTGRNEYKLCKIMNNYYDNNLVFVFNIIYKSK